MKKVAEQHIFTKCCKCNTFEVISDLVHDFMNFNALKISKKIYLKQDHCRGMYLPPSTAGEEILH